MRGVHACLIVAMLSAGVGAGGQGDPSASLRAGLPRLAEQFRRGDAAAKARLIEAGPAALEPLFGLVADRDPRVAEEARSALRWIALRAAEKGAPAGQREQVFAAALPHLDAKRPLAERRAALELLGLVGDGSVDHVKPLARLVLSEDPLAEDALAALGQMGNGGVGALTCLVEHDGRHLLFPDYPTQPVKPALKARAMELVASRPLLDSGRPDVMLEFLRRVAESEHEAVRAAALKGLGAWGHATAAPLVREALRSGTPRVKAAAFEALLAVAAEQLRQGKREAAHELCVEALSLATDEPQRIAALATLGQCGQPAALPLIAPLLKSDSPRLRSAAYGALCQVQGAEGTRSIAEALPAAPAEHKPLLLRTLGSRGDPSARPPLAEAALDADEPVALEAVRGLEQLGDPDAAAALLEPAKAADSEEVRAAALQAAVRLCHRLADRGEGARVLPVLQEVSGLAHGEPGEPDILRGLAKTGQPAAADLLWPVAEDKDHPSHGVAIEALLALADLAAAKHPDAAASIYRRLIDSGPPDALAIEATKKLLPLGVSYSPAVKKGFITTWWVLGPFPCADFREAKKGRPLERRPDPRKTHKEGDAEFRWQPRTTLHPQGRVDLNALLSPNDNVLAYAYTELTASKAMDVKLHLRRDDGLTLWLNGKKLYDVHDAHGCDLGEYTVDARLAEGVNRLLVKCSKGGGAWEFSLRLTDPAGQPLPAAE
jgi:HEAT repeat protein